MPTTRKLVIHTVILMFIMTTLAGCGGNDRAEGNTGITRDPEITVTNAAGQNLFSLIVTVSGQEVIFQNVPEGETEVMSFEVTQEDRFAVRGFLQDGTRLNAGFGQVSPANDAQQNDVSIIVREFGLIEFEQ